MHLFHGLCYQNQLSTQLYTGVLTMIKFAKISLQPQEVCHVTISFGGENFILSNFDTLKYHSELYYKELLASQILCTPCT